MVFYLNRLIDIFGWSCYIFLFLQFSFLDLVVSSVESWSYSAAGYIFSVYIVSPLQSAMKKFNSHQFASQNNTFLRSKECRTQKHHSSQFVKTHFNNLFYLHVCIQFFQKWYRMHWQHSHMVSCRLQEPLKWFGGRIKTYLNCKHSITPYTAWWYRYYELLIADSWMLLLTISWTDCSLSLLLIFLFDLFALKIWLTIFGAILW